MPEKVVIIGSASPEGSDEYNQKLSERRVGAVKTWLMEKGGIPESRLTTEAIGEVAVEPQAYPFERRVHFQTTGSR